MTVRPIRTLSLLLFLSLGLNMFLGGMVVSRWLAPPPPWFDGGGPPGRDFGRGDGPPMHRLADGAELAPAYRAQVRALWDEMRPRMHAQMHAVRAARRQVHHLLVAEDLDLEALAAAQQTLSARLSDARETMQAHLRAIAALLPPEQRQRYFEEAMRGHGPGRRGAGPPGRAGCPGGAD